MELSEALQDTRFLGVGALLIIAILALIFLLIPAPQQEINTDNYSVLYGGPQLEKTIETSTDYTKETISFKNAYGLDMVLFTIVPKNLASHKNQIELSANVDTDFVADDPVLMAEITPETKALKLDLKFEKQVDTTTINMIIPKNVYSEFEQSEKQDLFDVMSIMGELNPTKKEAKNIEEIIAQAFSNLDEYEGLLNLKEKLNAEEEIYFAETENQDKAYFKSDSQKTMITIILTLLAGTMMNNAFMKMHEANGGKGQPTAEQYQQIAAGQPAYSKRVDKINAISEKQKVNGVTIDSATNEQLLQQLLKNAEDPTEAEKTINYLKAMQGFSTSEKGAISFESSSHPQIQADKTIPNKITLTFTANNLSNFKDEVIFIKKANGNNQWGEFTSFIIKHDGQGKINYTETKTGATGNSTINNGKFSLDLGTTFFTANAADLGKYYVQIGEGKYSQAFEVIKTGIGTVTLGEYRKKAIATDGQTIPEYKFSEILPYKKYELKDVWYGLLKSSANYVDDEYYVSLSEAPKKLVQGEQEENVIYVGYFTGEGEELRFEAIDSDLYKIDVKPKKENKYEPFDITLELDFTKVLKEKGRLGQLPWNTANKNIYLVMKPHSFSSSFVKGPRINKLPVERDAEVKSEDFLLTNTPSFLKTTPNTIQKPVYIINNNQLEISPTIDGQKTPIAPQAHSEQMAFSKENIWIGENHEITITGLEIAPNESDAFLSEKIKDELYTAEALAPTIIKKDDVKGFQECMNNFCTKIAIETAITNFKILFTKYEAIANNSSADFKHAFGQDKKFSMATILLIPDIPEE